MSCYLQNKIRHNQVNIMKTTQSFTFKIHDLKVQTLEKATPQVQNYGQISTLPTYLSKLEPESHDYSSNSKKFNRNNWNPTQQQLFNQFWLQRFIENPCQNFSFDAPLNRKCHYKALSVFIKKRSKFLNVYCQKSPTQCKSKFGTIRRRFHRQRKGQSKGIDIGFIDFIIKNAQNMEPRQAGIEDKIKKVKELRENYSPYLKIILQQYRFYKSKTCQDAFILITNYLTNTHKASTLNQSQ